MPQDPGRQLMTGSFHPLAAADYDKNVYSFDASLVNVARAEKAPLALASLPASSSSSSSAVSSPAPVAASLQGAESIQDVLGRLGQRTRFIPMFLGSPHYVVVRFAFSAISEVRCVFHLRPRRLAARGGSVGWHAGVGKEHLRPPIVYSVWLCSCQSGHIEGKQPDSVLCLCLVSVLIASRLVLTRLWLCCRPWISAKSWPGPRWPP